MLDEAFEFILSCVKDKTIKRKEAWDLLSFYDKLCKEYPNIIDQWDMRPPQDDPDIGFVFVLDDDEKVLEIEYDLVQISLDEIEHYILASGVDMEQSWLDKVHDALLHLSEEGELGNLGHPYKDDSSH